MNKSRMGLEREVPELPALDCTIIRVARGILRLRTHAAMAPLSRGHEAPEG